MARLPRLSLPSIPQHVAPRGAPAALARDIVLVLDNPGSMRQNDPATLTRQAVATFVGKMDPDTHIGMVFFDSEQFGTRPRKPVPGHKKPRGCGVKVVEVDGCKLRTSSISMAAVAIGSFGSSVDGHRARRRLSDEGSQEGDQNEFDGTVHCVTPRVLAQPVEQALDQAGDRPPVTIIYLISRD